MNFVRLYIGDYMRDTGALSVSEHGAYMLMLLHYYATERPLPSGRELYRLLRTESKAEREAVDNVVRKFWTVSGEGLVNGRADREIDRADHQRTVNRTVGKLGGRPKREETESDTESDTESVTNRNRSETLTRHQTPYIHPPSASHLAPPTPAKASRTSHGTRIPPDWTPGDEGLSYASAKGLANGRVAAEVERFRDYWIAQAGAKGRKADWAATWRNWVQKAAESQPARTPHSEPAEPAWRRDQRERNEAFLGPAAARRTNTIDLEDSSNGTPASLG